jgi:hypothetical protein
MAALFPVPLASATATQKPCRSVRSPRVGVGVGETFGHGCGGADKKWQTAHDDDADAAANRTDAIAPDRFVPGVALPVAVLSADRAEQAHERKALTSGNKVDNETAQSVSHPKKFDAI